MKLHNSLEDLVPDAQIALREEIERRGIDPEAIRSSLAVAARTRKAKKASDFRRVFYWIPGFALAGFLIGALDLELGALPTMALYGSSGMASQWLLARLLTRRS